MHGELQMMTGVVCEVGTRAGLAANWLDLGVRREIGKQQVAPAIALAVKRDDGFGVAGAAMGGRGDEGERAAAGVEVAVEDVAADGGRFGLSVTLVVGDGEGGDGAGENLADEDFFDDGVGADRPLQRSFGRVLTC